MLDWLIIGGGIHGTHIALKLKASGCHNFRILDPHPELLYNWKWCTCNTGMQYLRSPEVHHIGVQPFDLKKFVTQSSSQQKAYISPNNRPSLSVFNAYADLQLKTHNMDELHEQATATQITIEPSGISVDTDQGKISARRVVLALGKTNQLLWPGWASELKVRNSSINHVFDTNFTTESLQKATQKVIIGGGLSAAQLALRLLKDSEGQVVICSPHPLKKSDYDTNPGWMGSNFYEDTPYSNRRNMISQARNRGTITIATYRELQKHIAKKNLTLKVAKVRKADFLTPELMLLFLNNGESLVANEIILATGFEKQRPGGILVDRLIEQYGLDCAECGYPIPSKTLEWENGIFVTGPFAELELGPTAANIIGARHAAQRLNTVF